MKPRLLVICNALDDLTRQERSITTDSPAASRKIFMLCHSLQLARVRVCVVSLGRGRAGGEVGYFPAILRRINGVPVVYMPFLNIPLLSELLSLLAPLAIIFKLRKQSPKAIIFYNRLSAYIPSLLMSSFFGYKNVLDLEDGEVGVRGEKFRNLIKSLVIRLFDRFCKGGALLACSALSAFTRTRPHLIYYGVVTDRAMFNKWQTENVTVLMSGTLCVDTGANLLINTIRELRRNSPHWASKLCIEVTGKGSSLNALILLAAEPGYPRVVVHGRTSDAEYKLILRRSDVGLALKLNSGPLAQTTFPSKVIEFASDGLLVLTTDISDVRHVLGNGALYLTNDEPNALIDLLETVVIDRESSIRCAKIGLQNVQNICSEHKSGKNVANFIFGTKS